VTYVIAEPCIDVLARARVQECPVDCIHEGARALYIHPDEYVDCGAREPVRPAEAIIYQDDVPNQWAAFTDDNARFFAHPRPGPEQSVASPVVATKIGRLGVDTALVAAHPPLST
jgi:NAD-dependent dihydropyrimidine dehydrogenase PreA subunit